MALTHTYLSRAYALTGESSHTANMPLSSGRALHRVCYPTGELVTNVAKACSEFSGLSPDRIIVGSNPWVVSTLSALTVKEQTHI